MSPEDRLFAGKRRGCGSKYRMVFSQRHELLNHYINKAGFKVADGGRTKHKRKTTDEKRHFDDDNGLFETDSSNSEAEEVNVHYGEEELTQSLGHETCSCPSVSSVSESCGQETPEEEGSVIKLYTKRKRKAAFLTDSDMDTSTGATESKASMKSFSEQKNKPYSPKTETDVINNSRRPTSTLGRTSSDEVIISPSLLVSCMDRSYTCRRTLYCNQCFRLTVVSLVYLTLCVFVLMRCVMCNKCDLKLLMGQIQGIENFY